MRWLEIEKEMLRGYIDPIILSLLSEQDRYGYDLSKEAKKRSNEQFELKEGTLYLAFKRLEKNNFVSSYWQEGSAARRKYYTITDLGRTHLARKKEEWAFIKKLMDTFYEGANSHE